MTVATLLADCTRPVVVDAPAGTGHAGATPANVQSYDNAHLLPWRESFDMVPLPAMVPPVERRRRVDGRTLAQVVKAVAA